MCGFREDKKLTATPKLVYDQFAQVSIGVIHEMVTSSSAMVLNAVSCRVNQSLPKYPMLNH